jgi:tRNA threonylcarbamoyl adenosine modification protein YjeE
MKQWIAKTENETHEIARLILSELRFPAIVCIYGILGAGKTSFCRSFIRAMLNNPNENIPSPTYSLVQTYSDEAIWHFDLYRLNNPEQLYDIGWEEALSAKICLIEWPEMLGNLKPQKSVDIVIDVLQDGSRQFTLK